MNYQQVILSCLKGKGEEGARFEPRGGVICPGGTVNATIPRAINACEFRPCRQIRRCGCRGHPQIDYTGDKLSQLCICPHVPRPLHPATKACGPCPIISQIPALPSAAITHRLPVSVLLLQQTSRPFPQQLWQHLLSSSNIY